MSVERFRRVSEIFDAACDLAGDARAAYLTEACTGDDALRAEVEALLKADAKPGGFHPRRGKANRDGDERTMIGRYRILSALGRGGQGTVYLAEDPRLRRKVAVKVLTALAARSPAMRTRLEREAEAASKLDHPAICAVYEVGEVEGTPFIAMRYVDGTPLSTLLASARAAAAAGGAQTFLDLTQAGGENAATDGESASGAESTESGPTTRGELMDSVHLVEKTARALHVAHEAGLIHRDVKPANILVKGTDPVIVDFGLARDEESDVQTLTETGQLMGTPAYMSAEQISGQNRLVDRRTDVYSLGVTLFECLTLARPFEAPTREQLYLKILTTDMPDPRRLNPRIPTDLKVVLETALEKDRDRRYQTALELAEELRRVREYQPIAARPVGPWTKTVRWAQRNPWVAAMLAVVIVLLSVSTGVFAWQRLELETKNEELGRTLDRVVLLKEQRTPPFLREWADTLFPAHPDRIPDLEAWLRDADALLGRLPAYRDALGTLEARAEPLAQEQRADRELLGDLVAELTALGKPDGVVAQVRARLSTAQSIRPRTLGDHAGAWRDALARIRANARYDKLAMTAQIGFIPLGPDQASGFEEFLHWESHERGTALPARDGDDPLHRFRLAGETGLVFVLIPGGTFRMGAERPKIEGELGPNVDPHAVSDEGPVHEVKLAPFLIAKHEMTKAQWRRIMGDHRRLRRGARHPVEQISWEDATRACGRVGLSLPTEAQWEYAARAGTHSIWPTGNDKSTLQGFANLADAFAKADGAPPRWVIEQSLDDGHRLHAPVGTLEPNQWGLYSVSGNVWEWCRDGYDGRYALDDIETGTGLHPVDSAGRVTRGGAYDLPATGVRSALRHGRRRDLRLRTIGVRPAALWK